MGRTKRKGNGTVYSCKNKGVRNNWYRATYDNIWRIEAGGQGAQRRTITTLAVPVSVEPLKLYKEGGDA